MIALLLAVALAAEPVIDAKAELTAKVRELVAAGQKLYTQRRFAEAMEKFEEAHSLGGSTTNLYNIGKCQERLGRIALALRGFREYRRLEPTAEKDAVLEGDIANGERRLREKGMQQLGVYAEPVTARISIDGVLLGHSPAYVVLEPGAHVLTVSADGYETTEYTFPFTIAAISERTVNLRPLPRDLGAGGDSPKEPPSVTATPRQPADPRPVLLEVPPPARRRRVGTWIAAGVAVGAAGAATGMGVALRGVDHELHTLVDLDRTGTQTTALMTRSTELATGTNVAIGLAAAAAVTAVILYFAEGP